MSERKNCGCLKNEVLDIPDLIEIQTKSFADFLQKDTPPEERLNQGLQEAFKDIFPAQKEPDGKASLEFVDMSEEDEDKFYDMFNSLVQ